MLLPIFLLLIFSAGILFRNSRYSDADLKGYFTKALTFRLIGAILTALMYQYYYGYGDTFYYYFGASDISRIFYQNPIDALEILFKDYEDVTPAVKKLVTYQRFFYSNNESLVLKLGGVFGIFTAHSFMGMSLGVTLIGFAGCWGIFRVFSHRFPHLQQAFAYAILYLPSLCFWGTGLMKDPLAIGGLGLFFYGFYFGLIENRKKLLDYLLIFLGAWLMKKVKIYVLAAALPASILWLFLAYQKKIQNKLLRLLAAPLLIVIGLGGALIAMQKMGEAFAEYTLEGLLDKANKTQWWLEVSTKRDGGTGYSLGKFDPSIGGLLRMFPKAVNVALFRPYVWEARKVIVLPAMLEALFSLCFSFYVLFKAGLIGTIKKIVGEPIVLFSLVFSIIFAFAVGFTSMNFGALARYKIPCLPFYFGALIILKDQIKNKNLENG